MSWKGCKNILCIRPDNMGDLIMSAPAIRALKKTFGARITVLTSSMAKDITGHIPEIDDVIIYDLPWVKTQHLASTKQFNRIVENVRSRYFDAAVIFTVFSQNPLPAAMLAYLAGIPKRLAYCRENPYQLLTDWVPDKEPYEFIKHQVRRDLDLVAQIGAVTKDENLHLTTDERLWPKVIKKLTSLGMNLNKPWLILHPGVSEEKRKYPIDLWVGIGKKLIAEQGYQLLLTGSSTEKQLTDQLQQHIGAASYSVAGLFPLSEFICLVKHAPLMLSVNTGTIHIAAAVGTKVVVLYAQTNPQHTPWNVPNKVLPFPVMANLRSKNEVISYLYKTVYHTPADLPKTEDVLNAITCLLNPQGLPAQPFREIPGENHTIAAS